MNTIPAYFHRTLLLIILGAFIFLDGCRPEATREKVYLKDTLGKLFSEDTPVRIKNTYSPPLSSDSFTHPKERPPEKSYQEGFYMITASFSSLKEARNYQKHITDKYQQTLILPSPQGYYRLAVKHFSRWRQATKYLQQQYQNGDTSIWILHHREMKN